MPATPVSRIPPNHAQRGSFEIIGSEWLVVISTLDLEPDGGEREIHVADEGERATDECDLAGAKDHDDEPGGPKLKKRRNEPGENQHGRHRRSG